MNILLKLILINVYYLDSKNNMNMNKIYSYKQFNMFIISNIPNIINYNVNM